MSRVRTTTRKLARGRSGRLVMGDWHPVVRDPIDLLRLTFLVGAAVEAAVGNWGAALRLGGTFALVMIARLLEPPRLFDLGFTVGMLLQGWGNVLNGFERFGWYDEVVHVLLSGFTAPLWYLLAVRLDAVPDLVRETARHKYAGIVVITMAFGTAFGALYEIYEYYAVTALGADLTIGYRDTVDDMLGNMLASLVGGLLLVGWSETARSTRRRSREDLATLDDEREDDAPRREQLAAGR